MLRILNVRRLFGLVVAATVMVSSVGQANAAAPEAKLTGDRCVEVGYQGQTKDFVIAPASWKVVSDEELSALPVFNPKVPSWQRGLVLRGVDACECSVFGALDPKSVIVKLEDGAELTRGKDYEFDETAGTLGRLQGGKITDDTKVLVSYRCVESRIDSIISDPEAGLVLVSGRPQVLSPEPPVLEKGQKRLVNVYTTGRGEKLSVGSLFPIDEVFANELTSLDAHEFVLNVDKYDEENKEPKKPEISDVGAAKKFVPKTWAKLVNGDEVRVLAWGDSVTACGFLPDEQRWQIKFSNRLREMFPNATIVMMTEAWGGRSSDSYRNEPVGSPKNYKEKVLDLKPDLIISEFVNDAYMDEPTVAKKYGEMLGDFQKIGAEWIILGPHYIRPDWMGLSSENGVDDDPRPLVKGLRAFAIEKGVPFADTPTLYGKLWRSGIPYNTLMTNNINHPNNFGMELFAEALARLFEE